MNGLILRAERPEDYKATELMALRSFWNKYWPGATEHFLIRIVRESADYLPEISRVAELDGKIVGAVFYTKAWIVDSDTKHEIATFGPLAVEPTLEGNDIGGALMRETIRLAREASVAGIALIGEPYYYPRFGFRRGSEFGITDANGNSGIELMVLPLNDDFSSVKGKLIESADFEKLEDEARLAEINKEFPAYRKVKVQDGFMQIFGQHLGVIEAIEGDVYQVRYWEKRIPARLDESMEKRPSVGDDVQFIWNHHGISTITKVFKNRSSDGSQFCRFLRSSGCDAARNAL